MSTAPIIGHYINGQIHDSAERFSDVFNPATGAVQARVALAELKTR
jgi:malonate-semialdehyde dehydrogenase (acetylating)/methylmalonate-semialdehyde dehydrogenase